MVVAIFGVKVENEGLSRACRKCRNALTVSMVVGLLSMPVELVGTIWYDFAFAATGVPEANRFRDVYATLLIHTVSIVLIFFAYRLLKDAVRTNNKSGMLYVFFFQGVSSGCAFGAALGTCWLLHSTLYLRSYLLRFDCSVDIPADTTVLTGQCQSSKETFLSLFGVIMAFCVAALVLNLIDALALLLGAVQANKCAILLSKGHTFTSAGGSEGEVVFGAPAQGLPSSSSSDSPQMAAAATPVPELFKDDAVEKDAFRSQGSSEEEGREC